MIITIVGSGNAGCAHAAKLAKQGHRVRMLKTSHAMHDVGFDRIVANGGIMLTDLDGTQDVVPIEAATRDPSVALKDADVALVLVQTLYHEAVAELIAPAVNSLKMLIVVPGYMGSIFFHRKLDSKVGVFAEGESTPYDARAAEDGSVRILFKNVRNALAFFSPTTASEGLAIARQMVETYGYTRRHIAESALHNPNLIVHTVGAIMSAARIEHSGGEFWMYREGFTPSVWNVIERLDDEKMALLAALGCERIRYLDACRFRNEVDESVDSLQVFQTYARTGGPKGPSCVNSRYIYEDVPMGLCLMSSLGLSLGIPTPTCDALITIGGGLLKRDFSKCGRTVERLGITRQTLMQLAQGQ